MLLPFVITPATVIILIFLCCHYYSASFVVIIIATDITVLFAILTVIFTVFLIVIFGCIHIAIPTVIRDMYPSTDNSFTGRIEFTLYIGDLKKEKIPRAQMEEI